MNEGRADEEAVPTDAAAPDTSVRAVSAVDLLDSVEEWCLSRQTLEVRVFRAAALFSDMHSGDARTTTGQVLPGMEQAKRIGGAGTPEVMEFAAALLGAKMGLSSGAARRMMADALDVRHRFPRVWSRLCDAEVEVWLARKIAQRTRHLSQEAAATVDDAVSRYADGRMSWFRFESLLEGAIVRADPEAAAAREEKAAKDQFVRVGQANEHGIKTMYVRGLGRDIIYFDAMVAQVAAALAFFGDNDSDDVRRARAVGVLANPLLAARILQEYATAHGGSTDSAPNDRAGDTDEGATGLGAGGLDLTRLNPRDLLPRATIYIHLSQETVTRNEGGVARWEGEGPVTAQHIRDLLGPHCSFVIKPVIDLENMAPVDAYEIPERFREAVHLRTPTDCFPFGTSQSRSQDIDHTTPYVSPDNNGPPGQTHLAGLGPLSRFHHRIKTHGGWDVRQPFSGIYVWRSPLGEYYLTDHTGTRKASGRRARGAAQSCG